jgi:hypothetical protein
MEKVHGAGKYAASAMPSTVFSCDVCDLLSTDSHGTHMVGGKSGCAVAPCAKEKIVSRCFLVFF